jgi:hypothetical protein
MEFTFAHHVRLAFIEGMDLQAVSPGSVFLVVGESDLKCLVHSVEVLLTRSFRIFLVLSGMDIQNEIYERRTESIPWKADRYLGLTQNL